MKAAVDELIHKTRRRQSQNVGESDQRRRTAGFTLIELAITVAIVAIVAVIAYPSYRQYAFRAHRAEAKNLLLQAASRQERFYATHSPNSYAKTMTALGYGQDSEPTKGKYYKVSVSDVIPTACGSSSTPCNGFTLTATPQAGQTDDPCKTLTLNSAGEEKAPNAINGQDGTQCWHK